MKELNHFFPLHYNRLFLSWNSDSEFSEKNNHSGYTEKLKKEYQTLTEALKRAKKEFQLAKNHQKKKYLHLYVQRLEEKKIRSFKAYEEAIKISQSSTPDYSKPFEEWETQKEIWDDEDRPLEERMNALEKEIDDIHWNPSPTQKIIKREESLQKKLIQFQTQKVLKKEN